MARGDRFGEAWWSLRLAPAWRGKHDNGGATITGDVGELQVSAARKHGAAVSDADLREFAEDLPGPTRTVSFGPFVGFEHALEGEGVSWRRWFLRSEGVVLFVTYNCDPINTGAEDLEVAAMLHSLRRIGGR